MKSMSLLAVLLFFTNGLLLNAKDITVNYDVRGMMCAMNCPDFIKDEAKRVDGVKKCEVDFNKSSAIITFDDTIIDRYKLASILSKNTENMYDIKIKEQESNQSWWNWIFGG